MFQKSYLAIHSEICGANHRLCVNVGASLGILMCVRYNERQRNEMDVGIRLELVRNYLIKVGKHAFRYIWIAL